MTLSVSLPTDDELEKALDNAQYLLCRRSGFVSSDTYSDNQMRKKDLYVLKAGACIHNRYSGDVYDVSDHIGSHPVYRYAKPMFLKA
jgi:CRISPR-associated protein Csm4